MHLPERRLERLYGMRSSAGVSDIQEEAGLTLRMDFSGEQGALLVSRVYQVARPSSFAFAVGRQFKADSEE